MKILIKLSDAVNNFAKILMVILMISISILLFIQVFSRYVLNASLFWAEELGRYFLIWITFLGASIGVKYKSHIGIDFFYRRYSPRVRKFFDIIIIISGLLLSFIMFFYGIKISLFVRFQQSSALLIPMSIPYISIAVGGMFIFIHYMVNFLEFFKSSDKDIT